MSLDQAVADHSPGMCCYLPSNSTNDPHIPPVVGWTPSAAMHQTLQSFAPYYMVPTSAAAGGASAATMGVAYVSYAMPVSLSAQPSGPFMLVPVAHPQLRQSAPLGPRAAILGPDLPGRKGGALQGSSGCGNEG